MLDFLFKETRTVAVEASESTESRAKGRAAPPEEPCKALVAERSVAAAISGVSLMRDWSPPWKALEGESMKKRGKQAVE